MNLLKLPSVHALRKVFLWALDCLALYTFTGVLLFPFILQAVLTSQLSKALHREVSIQKIQFNPFTLSAQIKGFAIQDREGTGAFVSFEELFLDLQAASVIEDGPVLRTSNSQRRT